MIGFFALSTVGKTSWLLKSYGGFSSLTTMSGVAVLAVEATTTRLDPTLTGAAIATVISSISALILVVMNNRAATKERFAKAEEREAAAKERVLAARERTSALDKAEAVAEQVKVLAQKNEQVLIATSEIKGHVDGMNTTLREQKIAADQQISMLTERLAKADKASELRAQAAAAASIVAAGVAVASAQAAPLSPAADSLEHIDANTERTADNTKRTEKIVTALEEKG